MHVMTSGGVARYEIRVRGRLDETWFDWPAGITCAFEAEPEGLGITVLTGSFDQAALRALLARLWDFNLTVLGVVRRDEPAGPGTISVGF